MSTTRILIAVFSIAIICSCSKKSAPTSATHSPAATSVASMQSEILRYVNQYRSSKKLPPLQMNVAVSDAAMQHSKNMAQNKVPFGHSGFSNRVSSVEAQIGAVKTAGENVAYGKITARQVVDGWLKSKPHRTNIEGNYNLIGIGVAQSKSGIIYFTQLFIRK